MYIILYYYTLQVPAALNDYDYKDHKIGLPMFSESVWLHNIIINQ